MCAQPLYRRVALLNTVAIAAIFLLAVHPSLLRDMSFELSFLAAGSIAGLALPWIDRTSERYLAGLMHLGDVPRDFHFLRKSRSSASICARLIARMSAILPEANRHVFRTLLTLPLRAGLRLWELFVLSFALQIGMLVLLAFEFHRVTWQDQRATCSQFCSPD